ncbi:MAG: transaldolase, partial [Planctomycetota bacterium]
FSTHASFSQGSSEEQRYHPSMNQLESLRQHTVVVADTGEIDLIEEHRPQDATTNPSLIAKAFTNPAYGDLIARARERAQGEVPSKRVEAFLDHLFVVFGCRILELVPGRVSTEVLAGLSFDVNASLDKAHRLIELYAAEGIDRERVLIKLATTWEGVEASRQLEQEGIHCNMTLLFGLVQAVAAAEAKATLISPFVGRIFDWHKRDRGVDDIPIAEDPGVQSVADIYTYLKKFGYPIQVMGASFRKADQITALAGCDLLTIAPNLLDELAGREGEIACALSSAAAAESDVERLPADEKSFRWYLNEEAMATEKLAQGIRSFHADTLSLQAKLQTMLEG